MGMRTAVLAEQAGGNLVVERSRKQDKHIQHPASHAAYSTLVSDDDCRIALHVGFMLGSHILRGIGFGPLLDQHSTLLQAVTALTASHKPNASRAGDLRLLETGCGRVTTLWDAFTRTM